MWPRDPPTFAFPFGDGYYSKGYYRRNGYGQRITAMERYNKGKRRHDSVRVN